MKLIILNGPTGVGKSTLANRLHNEMPSSVLLHIDELRRAIPNYREQRAESLRMAYDQAAGLIEKYLREGKDVIIDITIAETDTLDRFTAIATHCGATTHEFLLFVEKDVLQKRADDRGYIPGGLLTPDKVAGHWESANKLRAMRETAFVIDTTLLGPEEVFRIVADRID